MRQRLKDAPKFQKATDALVALIHSCMLLKGCKLIALDEEGPVNNTSLSDFPTNWNQDVYCFRYMGANSEVLLIKCLPEGDKITAYASKRNASVTVLELQTGKHIDLNHLNDSTKCYKNMAALQKTITDQLIEPCWKQTTREKQQSSTQEEKKDASDTQSSQKPQYTNPQPNTDPLRIGPPRPMPSGPQPRPMIPVPGGDFGRDLDPFGGSGGSLMGPGNRIFDPRGGRNGMGPLPAGLPPGARFDPVGPFGGGQPDPDHMTPPGMNRGLPGSGRRRNRRGPGGFY